MDWDIINIWHIDWDISRPTIKMKLIIPNIAWISPPKGWIKINVDGAAKGNPGPIGYGRVAHYYNGT